MQDRRNVIVGGALLAGAAAIPGTVRAALTPGSAAEQFAARLSAHDIEGFAALFSDDYINHQLSAAATSPKGIPPKQGTVAYFRARLAGMPDLMVHIETQVVAGDKVAASFVYEGTHQGPYFGVAPTGRKLHFTSCDIFRVQDGKIVEHWGMGDIAGILAQLRGPAAT
ncbi:MAG: ester cyclase [Candidatus Sphingomonas phytovorans]|nr:ester cyclase [Sphingomonas sp.]WEK02195.1 MAG: ester cyclase [Sphingomonas sp.]